MIFKPFVLLASALATLQVANGAALAERATDLCCADDVNPSTLAGPLLTILTGLASAAGVTLNTGLGIGLVCTAPEGACGSTDVALTCDVTVLGFFGINCSPTPV